MIAKRAWIATMVAGFLFACLVPCAAQPVAILTEAEGSIQARIGERRVPADPMAAVAPGTVITLAPGARAVLAYCSGGWVFVLQGEGRYRVAGESVVSIDGRGRIRRRNLADALRALRIRAEGPTLQGSVSMRGADGQELAAHGPLGSQLSRDRLVVCWTLPGQGWNYRVRLIDEEGHVVFERFTSAGSLALPQARKLQPESTYVWQLTAWGAYGRSAEQAGQFRRVGAATERALDRAAAMAEGGDATDRALYAIARLQLGFSVPEPELACFAPPPH